MAKPRSRRLVFFLVGVFALATLLYWQRGAIALRLVENGVDRITANGDPIAALPDGLHVGICGAGSPMTDAHRAGPCTAVIAGSRMFVFDAGGGAAARLLRMELNPAQIEAIFLTHYHSDHIDGLGELLMQRWVGAAATQPPRVFGPTGLESVVNGFRDAYRLDQAYRTGHHGEQLAPPAGFSAVPQEFDIDSAAGRQILIDEDALQIVAFAVDHGPVAPAVGYRIRYKGRTVVISGDTRRSQNVEREAKNVDLLLHEALSMKLVQILENGFDRHGRSRYAQIMRDIRNYHSSPEDAASVAAAASVRHLVLHHIVPPLPLEALKPEFIGNAATIFSGPIDVARDGDWYSLPAGGDAIIASRRP
jgi:ribonuclease Z